jgi:predicted Zn-dependent protease
LEYQNPQVPDEVNVSEKSPLKDFFTLALSVAAIAAALVFILSLNAEWLAPKVPFSIETQLAQAFELEPSGNQPAQAYLQQLADKLAAAEALPPEMKIRVHYSTDPTVNAFATLGGNVVLFSGLVEKLSNENALAMVMAHEIAHVKHRHPITALGRGLAVGLVVSVISESAGNAIAQRVIGNAGLLTVLTFNRRQEEEADATTLEALAKVYGHVGGAQELFKVMQAERGEGHEPPKFLSTHPLTEERIKRIKEMAKSKGWALNGKLTSLPAPLSEFESKQN